ncbi:MAG: AraC family transcriptional regulator [Ruminococcaceae bacterium]|nr:AraC family transcriptional regulator [Oscillospiraceae bacterium]
MRSELHTEKFHIQYKDDIISSSLLWGKHCHDQFEMIIVLDGHISVTVEGRDFLLGQNEMIVVPPFCYHTISANKDGRYNRITIFFDSDSIPASLSKSFTDGNVCVRELDARMTSKLQSIFFEAEPYFYAPLAEGLTLELLYEPPRKELKKEGCDTDVNLQKMLSYIDEHISDKITLEDIATHASLSVSSVCHIFSAKMKISPRRYLIQKKMALATKLIRSGVPATLAAEQVGYEDYSGFYKTYKKQTGKPPSSELK